MPRSALLLSLLIALSSAAASGQSAFTIQRRDAAPSVTMDDDDVASENTSVPDKRTTQRKAVATRRARARLQAERARLAAEQREEAARRAEADRWKTQPYWARDRQGRYHDDSILNHPHGDHAANGNNGCVSLDGLPLS